MSKNTKIILIVVGVILLLLCMCSAGVAFFIAKTGKKVSNEINKELQDEKRRLDEENATPTPTATKAPLATPKPISGGKTYSNAEADFDVMYPKDWTMDDENTYGALVLFYAPKDSSTDSFVENLNVITEDLSRDYTLEEYTDAALSNVKKSIQNVRVESERTTTLGGEKAHEVIYTGTTQGVSLRWKQTWAIHDGRAYIVTYTGKESGFDKYASDANNIVASLEYTK